MIVGIGTDVVQVDRMKIYLKNDIWKKVFTEKEYEYALSKRHTLQHLAGMWAAKEAAFKANGSGFPELKTGVSFDPLLFEIRHYENGAPYLFGDGLSREYSYRVSISHEKEYAIAYVLLQEIT